MILDDFILFNACEDAREESEKEENSYDNSDSSTSKFIEKNSWDNSDPDNPDDDY